MSSQIEVLIHDLNETISTKRVNEISKEIISLLKSGQVSREDLLKQLDLLKNPKFQLNYYRSLLRFGFVKETLYAFEDAQTDRFTLEYLSKNISRYISSEEIFNLLTNPNENNHIHAQAFRSLLIKKVRKVYPQLISRLLNHQFLFDPEQKVHEMLLLYLPSSTSSSEVLQHTERLYQINENNLLIDLNQKSTQFLQRLFIKRPLDSYVLVEKKLENIFAENPNTQPLDALNYINIYKPKKINNSHIKSQEFKKYISLIEKYSKFNGSIVLPYRFNLSLLLHKLNKKTFQFYLPILRKIFTSSDYYMIGSNQNTSEMRLNLNYYTHRPIAHFLFENSSFWSLKIYTQTLLTNIVQYSNDKDIAYYYDKFISSHIKDENFLYKLFVDNFEIIKLFPNDLVDNLIMKHVATLKKANYFKNPWSELSFYRYLIPSSENHKLLFSTFKTCNDVEDRAILYSYLFEHITFRKVTNPEFFTQLFKFLNNEPLSTKVLLLDQDYKYSQIGDYFYSEQFVNFHEEMSNLVLTAKDATSTLVSNAFQYLSKRILKAIKTTPQSIFDKNQDKINRYLNLFEPYLTKGFDICNINLGKRDWLLVYQFLKPFLLEQLKELNIHIFMKYFFFLTKKKHSFNIHKFNGFDLWSNIFSNEVFPYLVEGQVNMSGLINNYLYPLNPEKIETILKIDPSVISIKQVQDYLFKYNQEKLLTFSNFQQPITVENLKTLSNSLLFSFLKFGKDISFNLSLIKSEFIKLKGQAQKDILNYMINFISNPTKSDEFSVLRELTKYLHTYNFIFGDNTLVQEFLEKPQISESNLNLNYIISAKLYSAHPQNFIDEAISSVTPDNVSDLQGVIIRSLNYLNSNSWIQTVLKQLETANKPAVVKFLVFLIGRFTNQEIFDNQLWKVWNNKNSVANVRCFIMDNSIKYLNSSQYAWKVLEEASQHTENDVVIHLYNLEIPQSQLNDRFTKLIISTLNHPNLEIRANCISLCPIFILDSKILIQLAIDYLGDITSTFNSILSKLSTPLSSTKTHDDVSVLELFDLILKNIANELTVNQNKYKKLDQTLPINAQSKDLPVYSNIKCLFDNLFSSQLTHKEKNDLIFKYMDSFVKYEPILRIVIFKKIISSINIINSEESGSTIKSIIEKIETIYKDDSFEKNFIVSNILNELSKLYLRSNFKELALEYLEESDPARIIIGLSILKSSSGIFAMYNVKDAVSRLRNHSSFAVRLLAYEIILQG